MSRGQGERGRAECGGCGCGEKLARQLCMPQNWKSWPDCFCAVWTVESIKYIKSFLIASNLSKFMPSYSGFQPSVRVWQTQSSALWTGEAQLTVLLPLHCLLRLVSFSVVLKQFEWLTGLKFEITI